MKYSKTSIVIGLIGFSFSVAAFPTFSKQPISDAQIKQRLIQQSISEYPGNCPCPYNSASNGSSCGRRSAYSKDNGYTPLSYPGDITASMILRYRQSHAAAHIQYSTKPIAKHLPTHSINSSKSTLLSKPSLQSETFNNDETVPSEEKTLKGQVKPY